MQCRRKTTAVRLRGPLETLKSRPVWLRSPANRRYMTLVTRAVVLLSLTVRVGGQSVSSARAGCSPRAPPSWRTPSAAFFLGTGQKYSHSSWQQCDATCQQDTRPTSPARTVSRSRTTIPAHSFTSSASTDTMPEKKAFERLPKNVVPSHYALRLRPYIDKFTFDGSEQIDLQIASPTNKIVMNSADIVVKEASYSGNGQDFKDNIKVDLSEEDETLTLSFPEDLKAGSGKLSLTFSGELNDKMKGFYRSKYTSPSGEDRYAAVTQFEATDARRAFPCWDEPAIKSTFDITLVVPKDRVALSNMPEKSSSPDSDPKWKVVEYESSPIMSTYLLAFVVGEYDFIEAKDADGVTVRVYTPVGKTEQGKFALDVAVKTLPFYNRYFNIAYPLPKIDLIAISDFAAGAMENWGLVTYRETALLVDPVNSSSSGRQRVALVVGHELAHQWFGNLVTMEWWTHLWLNEGFASWIEYLCVDECFPDYDIWTQFAVSDFNIALDLDALKNSHPIEVPVGHPSEVDEIFDAISYSKGASVIRMLHDYIGQEDYKAGMHEYLEKHKYKNTFTEDLWASLEEASGKPINRIMSTWTKQMGFPVLTVSQKKEGTTRVLSISQKKFCADGSSEGAESLWEVPVSISTASSPEKAVHRFVLTERETTVTLENVAENDWVKLNTGNVGFFRTMYSQEMLDALTPGISDQTLPPRDRLGLQNDLFALARAGKVPLVDVLKVAKAFQKETNFTVWNDLSNNLATPLLLSQYTDFHEDAQSFVRELFCPIHDRLGWESRDGESHLDSMLRSLVITRLGKAGHQATVDEARKRFADHTSGTAMIPADLRAPVYATVLSQGGEDEFEKVLKLYKDADLHEERERLMRSLGATRKDDLIQKTLDFALSDDVRAQDTVFVIAGVTGSKQGREAAWKYLQQKWLTLHDRYQGGFLLARLVKSTTENFACLDRAKEIETFFEGNPAPAAERTIQQSLENVRLNYHQLKRDQDSLKDFFCPQ